MYHKPEGDNTYNDICNIKIRWFLCQCINMFFTKVHVIPCVNKSYIYIHWKYQSVFTRRLIISKIYNREDSPLYTHDTNNTHCTTAINIICSEAHIVLKIAAFKILKPLQKKEASIGLYIAPSTSFFLPYTQNYGMCMRRECLEHISDFKWNR